MSYEDRDSEGEPDVIPRMIIQSIGDLKDIRQLQTRNFDLSNNNLQKLSAEEMINRLKGVLYRIAGAYRLSEMTQMEFGGEMLAACMRSLVSIVVDSIKWIAWNNGLDPYEPFGDDTLVVMFNDLKLGADFIGPDLSLEDLLEEPIDTPLESSDDNEVPPFFEL